MKKNENPWALAISLLDGWPTKTVGNGNRTQTKGRSWLVVPAAHPPVAPILSPVWPSSERASSYGAGVSVAVTKASPLRPSVLLLPAADPEQNPFPHTVREHLSPLLALRDANKSRAGTAESAVQGSRADVRRLVPPALDWTVWLPGVPGLPCSVSAVLSPLPNVSQPPHLLHHRNRPTSSIPTFLPPSP
ncbi:hypothetical protein GQ53DRAFT_338077 [Thozetella sp. PMI_491]|nr:hypothetical protein GQ53DRAFT_338077 [Thozetella sp. PMI_491]